MGFSQFRIRLALLCLLIVGHELLQPDIFYGSADNNNIFDNSQCGKHSTTSRRSGQHRSRTFSILLLADAYLIMETRVRVGNKRMLKCDPGSHGSFVRWERELGGALLAVTNDTDAGFAVRNLFGPTSRLNEGAVLVLEDARPAHAGRYYCVLDYGRIHYTVSVVDSDDQEIMFYHARIGQPFALYCNDPKRKFRFWQRNGQLLTPAALDDDEHGMQIESGEHHSVIKFDAIRLADAALYQCVFSHHRLQNIHVEVVPADYYTFVDTRHFVTTTRPPPGLYTKIPYQQQQQRQQQHGSGGDNTKNNNTKTNFHYFDNNDARNTPSGGIHQHQRSRHQSADYDERQQNAIVVDADKSMYRNYQQQGTPSQQHEQRRRPQSVDTDQRRHDNNNKVAVGGARPDSGSGNNNNNENYNNKHAHYRASSTVGPYYADNKQNRQRSDLIFSATKNVENSLDSAALSSSSNTAYAQATNNNDYYDDKLRPRQHALPVAGTRHRSFITPSAFYDPYHNDARRRQYNDIANVEDDAMRARAVMPTLTVIAVSDNNQDPTGRSARAKSSATVSITASKKFIMKSKFFLLALAVIFSS